MDNKDLNDNLRVSTMTLVSGLDTSIDLQKLYENLSINEHIKYI